MTDIMEEARVILGESREVETQGELDLIFETAQNGDLLDESEAARKKMAMPKPNDSETIKKVRDIVREHQYAKIDGVIVDAFTAQTILQVFDNLNDKNQKRMAQMPIRQMASIAMKVAAR